MNAEQIANWRRILVFTLGPYALLMPEEQIEAIRERIQKRFEEIETSASQPCNCDPDKNGTTTHSSGIVTCNNCKRQRNN